MAQLVHTIGSYSLVIGILAQFFVLYRAVTTYEKPKIVQALLLILALGCDALAISQRPPVPPLLLPDLLECLTGLLLFTPAANAVREMLTASRNDDGGR